MFSEAFLIRAHELVNSYFPKTNALFPLIELMRLEYGNISDEGMSLIVDLCQVERADVRGVLSFYNWEPSLSPSGINIVVCTHVNCFAKGGVEILSILQDSLKDKNKNENDSTVSVEDVQCLGACPYAPVLSINGTYHENMTKEKALLLLEDLEIEMESFL